MGIVRSLRRIGDPFGRQQANRHTEKIGECMRWVLDPGKSVVRHLAAAGQIFLVGSFLIGSGAAFAQSGGQAAQDQGKPPAANAADAAKDNQRKTDEFVEAQTAINGPAGNPECVWLGRRMVRLMWNDDLDTAFRHLDLYDRFGCPAGHIQATFRCLVRQGNIDPKAPDTLNGRVHSCWINPTAETQGTAAAPSGTTNR